MAKKRASPKGRAKAAVVKAVSKRSGKLKALRKVATSERRSALLESLEARETQSPPADLFQAANLQAALAVIAAQPSSVAKTQQVPLGRSNKSKRAVLATETQQLQLVLQHPAFRSDPTATILDHLNNTLSPPQQHEQRKTRKKTQRSKRHNNNIGY